MGSTVVVIEDDADSRDWLVEALQSEGYRVLCASNGAEGLLLVAALQERPSLILLDMMMPMVDGWDVLAALAVARARRPPVVVVTAAKVHRVLAGAEAVLTKPVHIDELHDTVRRFAA
jgi:DNA-binding response OmpR family regulator